MEPTLDAASPSAAADAPKIKAMRRQPCPCGSGKKFKNCHIDDPAYEVAAEASEAGAAAATSAPGAANAAKVAAAGAPKHFPPHQQKSIPSQRAANSTHRRRV